MKRLPVRQKEIPMDEIRHISAADFAAMDLDAIKILDLREPDEVLINGIEGAINIPFSRIGKDLDLIPSDKRVYVICSTGDWSEEVVELLTDRGYDAINVDGGYKAYAEALTTQEPFRLDASGLRCPGPIVATADTMAKLRKGQRLIVESSEDAFVSDIAVWCERTGNTLRHLDTHDGRIEALIEKGEKPAAVPVSRQHDKTFIVFSGDLDKTIAAFIMANGAAAMGRKVTMFFTFWGLSILRRPRTVSAGKDLIERMFSALLPRGTKELGLSRMNMGGAGAKMIRHVMKKKGIRSLEGLIADALSHGVRLVACQMSMDIMGIRKEELIDGVELGGVATFLGAGESSDMSLFI